MPEHRCAPPARLAGQSSWRCHTCFTRYAWSKRYLSGRSVEGWQRMRDDFDTIRMRNEAEFNRSARRGIVAAVVVGVVLIALIVWIVLRVTS